MITLSDNDQNSPPPQDGEAPSELHELALNQKRDERVLKNQAILKRGLKILLFLGLIVTILPLAVTKTLDEFFPDWNGTSTLEWPNGLQVQVEERYSGGMDGISWTYTFSYSGQQIGEPHESFDPSIIQHGTSHGTPYFFMDELIGIYHPARSGSSPWVTWGPYDSSVTSWMNQFVSTRRKLRKRRKKEEFIQDANYKIVKCESKGRTWIISLRDANYMGTKANGWDTGDFYGGMHADLHVESRDFGAHWKVKEPVVIPKWLDEIHKR